jgi:hypothetical protein
MSLATSVSMPTRKNDREIVVLNNGGAWEVLKNYMYIKTG